MRSKEERQRHIVCRSTNRRRPKQRAPAERRGGKNPGPRGEGFFSRMRGKAGGSECGRASSVATGFLCRSGGKRTTSGSPCASGGITATTEWNIIKNVLHIVSRPPASPCSQAPVWSSVHSSGPLVDTAGAADCPA
ncbi:unnamed protein product [Ixodes hexagonus]